MTVAALYNLLVGTAVALGAMAWSMYSLWKLPYAWLVARTAQLRPSLELAAGNLLCLAVISKFPQPHGPLWEMQLIESDTELWHALVWAVLVALTPFLVVLCAVSTLTLAVGVGTWWATPGSGAWRAITNGTRVRRRWWSWCYQRLLVHQVKAYGRVQSGGPRAVTCERVFEAGEASSEVRITPPLNHFPLSGHGRRPFPALRWSSCFQHNPYPQTTVLQVRWDLAALDRGPLGRRLQRATIRGVLMGLSVALVVLGIAAVSVGDVPSDSPAGAKAVDWHRSVRDGDRMVEQLGSSQNPPWPGNDGELRSQSHSDVCRVPAAGVFGECASITYFTPAAPVTITRLGVEPYGVIFHRAVRRIVWEFNGNPASRIVQSVGPIDDWQIMPLRSPVSATMITAKVVEAVDTDRVSTVAGAGYKLIGYQAGQDRLADAHAGEPSAGLLLGASGHR
ncbi:hypothetical protein [Mycolicibacterium llatzerense]|uniref:hypothetical protein n=1 Tax=Mycolicibacterium llatzerense TaxID=280871 RepID=UPI0008DE683C|nr:hypothetical protein [Mycolicibacterium llatzerense]